MVMNNPIFFQRFAPRLHSFGGVLVDYVKRIYADYTLWRARMDDERCVAAFADNEIEHPLFAKLSGCRICANPDACPRSVLVVSADGINNLHRIRQCDGNLADVVMFDMTSCKGGAWRETRDGVMHFLQTEKEREAELAKTGEKNKVYKEKGGNVMERARYVMLVNSPEFDSANGLLDMELVGLLGDRIEGVALPHVTTNTYSLIEEYVHPNHRLWAFFDTPLSVAQANAICSQGHYKYAVMGLKEPVGGSGSSLSTILRKWNDEKKNKDGFNDCIATQMELLQLLPTLHSGLQVMLAARAYGMHVLDGMFDDISDSTGFGFDLRRCRALGFDGKLLARPGQIARCHATFAPTEEELTWAREVRRQLSRMQCGAVSEGVRHVTTHWQRAACFLERHQDAELENAGKTTEI